MQPAFALAYTRVSLDFERQPNSVAVHDASIRDYCALRSIVIVELFQENKSGTVPMERRPVGAQVLRGLREGVYHQGQLVRPTHLIFGAVDRIGRRAGPMMMLAEALMKRGIRVHIAEPGIGCLDLNQPAGWQQFQQLCVQAEGEQRRTVKRIRDTNDRRRRDGFCLTDRAPYGWDAVPSGILNPKPGRKHAELFRKEVNPEQMPWLRQMILWRWPLAPFHRLAAECASSSPLPAPCSALPAPRSALSLKEIARRLQSAGAPTATPAGVPWKNSLGETMTTSGLWQAGNVARILGNPDTLALAQEIFAPAELQKAA
jgi:DNA invertase Pin-like site-specific DNA recombinase